MAEGDGGGVGLVKGQALWELEHLTYHARNLLLACAPVADYGLLYPQGGVLKGGFAEYCCCRDGRPARCSEYLGCLEILHVNGLLKGDVADGPFLYEIGDTLVDFTEAGRHGQGLAKAEGAAGAEGGGWAKRDDS